MFCFRFLGGNTNIRKWQKQFFIPQEGKEEFLSRTSLRFLWM